MAYNISQFNNVSGIGDLFGAVNQHSDNIFIMLLFLALIIILTIQFIKSGNGTWRSMLFSLTITFIPALLLRMQEFQGVPLLADWFIIMQVALIAIFAILVYNEK